MILKELASLDGHIDVQPHQHLVCRACGRDEEVSLTGLDEITESLRERHGFVADLAYISLTGVCTSCQSGTAKVDQAMSRPFVQGAASSNTA